MKAHHCSIADVIPFSWVDGPGNRFVLFLQGCNFNCLACHNPHTIPLETPRAKSEDLDDVLTQIRDAMPYISGVTVSGGEATLQHAFIKELFTAIKTNPEFRHLTTMIDSNGHATRDVWDELVPVTDGVMLDLKALDDEVHRFLTNVSNDIVLESIKYLHSLGKLYEVRLLLIPGINDSDEQLRETVHWLYDLDPDLRIKINHFTNHGVRALARDWTSASDAMKLNYRTVLESAGMANVV